MANPPNTADRPLLHELNELSHKWGWMIFLGIVFLIGGFVGLYNVGIATLASVLVLGYSFIVAGVVEIVASFNFKSWGRFILWVLLGIATIAAGALLIANPVLGAATLTLFLGFILIASGALRIVLSFSMPKDSPWVLVLVSGIISMLLGGTIVARWPVSSLYSLGIFLSIDLIFAGIAWLMMGNRLRNVAQRFDARAKA